MTNYSQTLSDVMPSATPTEADLAAWEALPRDEQLHRLRLSLTNSEAVTPSTMSVADIIVRARARLTTKQNG